VYVYNRTASTADAPFARLSSSPCTSPSVSASPHTGPPGPDRLSVSSAATGRADDTEGGPAGRAGRPPDDDTEGCPVVEWVKPPEEDTEGGPDDDIEWGPAVEWVKPPPGEDTAGGPDDNTEGDRGAVWSARSTA